MPPRKPKSAREVATAIVSRFDGAPMCDVLNRDSCPPNCAHLRRLRDAIARAIRKAERSGKR